MLDSSEVVFEFGHFRLEETERRLLADGAPVHLTPKAFDVLCVLVRQGGRLVSKQLLMERVWPDTFVGDATLTRCVADLRKALGEAARDHRYIDTVAKQGYRFIAPVREIRPDPPTPIVREKSSRAQLVVEHEVLGEDRTAALHGQVGFSVPARTLSLTRGRRAALAAVVALLAAGLVYLREAARPGQAGGDGEIRSIAVLPFTPLDGSGPDEYLGLGISDALITRLSLIRRIAVRPTSAVRGFVAPHDEAVAAGRALKVDAVLEGTVQRVAGRLRVTVRLVNVHDGSSRWAGTFDESLDDLFAIEDSISERVAAALALTALGEERRRLARRDTASAEAHRAYLEGRYFFSKRTKRELEKAVELLERAVRLDPEYALAHAGLAEAYLLISSWVLPHETIPKARQAAETALRLDPSMAEANTALGLIAMNYDWDWVEAERRYRRAIDLNPSYSTAHHWLGEYLAWMGRFEEGIAEVRRAEDLDPLSLIIKTDVGKVLMIGRRYDDALVQLRRTLELDPNYAPARLFLCSAYINSGALQEARAVLEHPSLARDDQNVILSMAEIFAREGRDADVKSMRDRLSEISERSYVSPFFRARVHMLAGDVDAAVAELTRMCDERAPGVICLKVDPALDSLRTYPEYARLLHRVGFAP